MCAVSMPAQGCLGRMECLETQHRPGNSFDKSMVSFDDVVQVFDLANLNQVVPAKPQKKKVEVQQTGIIGSAFVDNDLF